MKKILASVPVFWLLQLSGWTGYAILYLPANFQSQSPEIRLTQSVSFAFTFAASFVLHYVCRRQWRAGLHFPKSVVIVLAWCAALAYSIATVLVIARQVYTHRVITWSRLPYLMENLPGMGHPGFTLIFWCALYFGIKYYHALEAERRRALAAESSAREAELRALRYQIHPHFLFNTLNAISTLTLQGNGELATVMVARLADFLRATLDGRSANEVPLSEELFLTEQYLEIEKIRLGKRLKVEMNVDTAIYDCRVPYLVLQPLVENAIRHGIAPRRGLGHLIIEAGRLNDKLIITVNDDGLGKTRRPEGESGNGQRVGLANIERRVKELYGDKGSFHLNWPSEGGCQVFLEMPYTTQNHSQV